MVRIDDKALAQSITERGALNGKRDNASRLAEALTVARCHPDTQDVLNKLSPDQLRHVVREASMVLQVKRNSTPTQYKIQRNITPPMQKAFADQLRMHGEQHRRDALVQSLAAASDVNVHADGWQDLHGGDAKASAYNSGFWQAAVDAEEQINTGRVTTAKQTLSFLANKRRDLALAANAPNANLFGIANDSTNTTFLNDERYGQFPALRPIVERVIRWSLEFRDTGKRPTNLPDNVAISRRQAGDECFFSLRMQASDGKYIPLSSYAMELDMHDKPTRWPNGTPKVSVNGGSRWNEIGPEVERLYQKALAPPHESLSVDQHLRTVGQNIGRLHYLLAHNPQYRRGSAGVYDMLAASIFLRHGYIFPGWKEKTAGDIQALGSLDPNSYAQNYLLLMKTMPANMR